MKKLISSVVAALFVLTLMPATVNAGGWGIPEITSPEMDEELSNFPRTAYIKWTPLVDAAFYEVEVTCDYCSSVTNKWSNPVSYYSYTNSYTTPALAGDNEFRVRVRGYHDQYDFYSSWSSYVYFYYDTSGYAEPVVTDVPPAGYEYEIPEYEYWINPFTDVDANDYEGAAAINLYYEGIIGGYPDGTFRPYNYVNRAETAKFISNVLYDGDVPDYGPYDNHGLWDLVHGQWYYDYVVAMLYAGIFDGNPDGSFRPGSYINAAELSKVLINAFDLSVFDCKDGYLFDVDCNTWYGDYAYTTAIKYKLFPKRELYFEPGSYVTRGEMAYAINLLMSEY